MADSTPSKGEAPPAAAVPAPAPAYVAPAGPPGCNYVDFVPECSGRAGMFSLPVYPKFRYIMSVTVSGGVLAYVHIYVMSYVYYARLLYNYVFTH